MSCRPQVKLSHQCMPPDQPIPLLATVHLSLYLKHIMMARGSNLPARVGKQFDEHEISFRLLCLPNVTRHAVWW